MFEPIHKLKGFVAGGGLWILPTPMGMSYVDIYVRKILKRKEVSELLIITQHT